MTSSFFLSFNLLFIFFLSLRLFFNWLFFFFNYFFCFWFFFYWFFFFCYFFCYCPSFGFSSVGLTSEIGSLVSSVIFSSSKGFLEGFFFRCFLCFCWGSNFSSNSSLGASFFSTSFISVIIISSFGFSFSLSFWSSAFSSGSLSS